ncbi:MAG: DUF58 domain-containing protein [Symbiobacterium sp.]|uniref:DUF58 domain-containing protein n=1 Tax=Symbiobacterium sp. TaxID=1971213 RepID=UPI003464B1B5
MRHGRRDWRLPALILVAFAVARLGGGELPYFLLYTTGMVWIGSWLATLYASRRVAGLLTVDRHQVQVGETIAAALRLENWSWLPVPWLEVDDETPPRLMASDRPRMGTALPPRSRRQATVQFTARRRGRCPVGPIRVRTGDPLGLFVREIQVRSEAPVTIYPRVHPLDDLSLLLALPFGPVRTRDRAFEDPSDHAEIRRYVPGDNPRHIHWPTTARTGTLMTRQYGLSATTQLVLFLDLHRSVHVDGTASGGAETAETAVEIAASLAALALRRKMEAGLFCVGQERFAVSPGGSDRTFREIMEVLAQVEAVGNVPVDQLVEAEAAHLAHRATVVVITPRLNQRLAHLLLRLRSSHRVMLVLLDAATFAGRLTPADGNPGSTADPDATVGATAARLVDMLALSRVPVYVVPAGADLSRLAALRVHTGEGVSPWPPRVHPRAIS